MESIVVAIFIGVLAFLAEWMEPNHGVIVCLAVIVGVLISIADKL